MLRLASDSEIKSAFSFIGNGRGDIGPKEEGQLAGELLFTRYRELMATLPSLEDFAERLNAWVKLNAPDTPQDMLSIVSWGELGLFELLQSLAIQLVVETAESRADIEKLRAAVAKAALRPTVPDQSDRPAVRPVTAIDQTIECVKDFKTLSSTDFKHKWLRRERRHIFDAACAEGRL